MNILPFCTESLDSFLNKSQKLYKEYIEKKLEYIDMDIYTSIDHNRFVLIRIDERTILSSYGILKFKRRYYYDNLLNERVYLLDNVMQIPKSKRMTNELILKILDLASLMSYKEVGEHLSNEFVLSKYTIWKVINDVLLEMYFDLDIDRGDKKIHVQIDEKYIGMIDSKNKKKYYTMTIFAGKELNGKSYKLLNKTVLSAASLTNLKEKLTYLLVNRYKVSPDEEIFISGDFATYIQCFDSSIYCCKCKYVPDKFHVYKAIKDAAPDLYINDFLLNDKEFQINLINQLKDSDNYDAKKLIKIMKKNPKIFETYLDPEYLGCSQEGQNSHIYAKRFAKHANRFSPSTIEKLSLIREARVMNATIIVVHKRREIPKNVFNYEYPEKYEDPIKYDLDTRRMKYETRKLFEEIKYGDHYNKYN